MNVKSILSAVLVLCSIGCIKASDNFISFQFSDDDCNGFKASAKYCKGYDCNSTYATNMSDFSGRVSKLANGAISFDSASRESYSVDSNCKYTLKPNRMGLYEQLKFNRVKCNSGDLNEIVFNGTMEYQPAVVLSFNSEDDANLPKVSCNNIPILRFDVNNPTDKGVRLRDFVTNGVTGLSYNTPLIINDFKCNNISCNPKQLSMLATVSDNNNKKICLSAYNNEVSDLGTDRCIKVPILSKELSDKYGLKIKAINLYKEKPEGVDCVIDNANQQLETRKFSDLVTQKGRIVFDITEINRGIDRSRIPAFGGKEGLYKIRQSLEKDVGLIKKFYTNDVSQKCNYLEFVIA